MSTYTDATQERIARSTPRAVVADIATSGLDPNPLPTFAEYCALSWCIEDTIHRLAP